MKIAVISDIHGNMQALEAVFEDIKKEKADKVLCLGDLAMAGPEPVKAVEFIKALKDKGELEIIQGNTDLMISTYTEEKINTVGAAYPIMSNALKNDIKLMPSDLMAFLNALPEQNELSIEGVKLLMVHGSVRKNDENISPDLPLETVEEMVSGCDADIIFCGHTHIPCGYQTSKKQTVVNVGSVGRPFTPVPQACYAVVELNNGEFNVCHKFVDYDNVKASEILAERQFEGADKLAQILIKPEFRHI